MVENASYAKYTMEYTKVIAKVQMDQIEPKIELLEVDNTNQYKYYANKTHTITIRVKVLENNFKENYFDKDHLQILVGNQIQTPENFRIRQVIQTSKMIMYELELSGIKGNGELKIKIPQGTIIDIAEQTNKETTINTNIQIDNIAPVVSFVQEETQNGKILAKFEANEKIQEVNAWERSEDQTMLSKEFTNNVTYPFVVTDYAQNLTKVEVDVTKATNRIFRYGGIKEGEYWCFGYGNNEIIGTKWLKENEKYKIEGISLFTDGEMEKDFIKMQVYVHTYWGEGAVNYCYTYENRYYHGYNPKDGNFATQKEDGHMIMCDGKPSLYLGGLAVNRAGNAAFQREEIPEEIAKQCLFGISEIRMELKDNSYDAIVYQVWVEGQGWQEAVCDGEGASFSKDKPIGAFRMSLIPQTEKQYLIDFWNKDIGTNNMK